MWKSDTTRLHKDKKGLFLPTAFLRQIYLRNHFSISLKNYSIFRQIVRSNIFKTLLKTQNFKED